MSKILINNEIYNEGVFSFTTEYDQQSNPPLVNISGVMTTKSGYLGSIRTIENDRYALEGVHVYQEGYGSEEDEIAYYFTAKRYMIAGYLQEVKTSNG